MLACTAPAGRHGLCRYGACRQPGSC